MFHGEGVAVPSLKRKREPQGRKAPRRPRGQKHERREHRKRLDNEIVAEMPSTAGIAATRSAAFAASDMSDASSTSQPSSAKSAAERLARTRRKQGRSIASAFAPMSFSPCGATSQMD